MPTESSAHPSLVLATYVASLLGGKRVAVLGDCTIGLAEHLAELTGRKVHCYDPDAARLAEGLAAGGASAGYYLLDDEVEVGEGSFDAVIVPDLGALSAWLAPARVFDLAATMVSRRGFALVAAGAHEAGEPGAGDIGAGVIAYAELHELAADRFAEVRMLGEAPFRGVTIADFGGGPEPDVSIDGSLMRTTEAPTRYLVVASHQPVNLDPYALVQVPAAEPALANRASTSAEAEAEAEAEAARAEAARQAEALRGELDRQREQCRELRELGREREATHARLSSRVAELEGLMQRRDEALARYQGLEARLERARERADAADARSKQARLELEMAQAELERDRDICRQEVDAARGASEHDRDLYQRELDAMLDRIAELEEARSQRETQTPAAAAALDEARARDDARLQRLEARIAELEGSLSAARAESDARGRELAVKSGLETRLAEAQRPSTESAAGDDAERAAEIEAYERTLAERGAEVARLRADLVEAERTGLELVRRLERRTPGDGGALESLTREHARCEADLAAARWRVDALAAELRELRIEPSGDQAALEHALRAAHAELAKLRRDGP